MTYKPDLVYYHYPCSDGLAAASVVFNHYKNEGQPEYVQADYANVNNAETLRERCRDQNVLLVDFSFKPKIIEQVIQTCESLVILDHHKNAGEAMKPWNYDGSVTVYNADAALEQQKCITVFNQEESGATMAWNFFNPGKDIPTFLTYIRDIDLHQLKLPRHRDFQWFSRSIPFVIGIMADYTTPVRDGDIESFLDQGVAIKKFVDTRMDVLMEQTRYGSIGGIIFPWNITDYALSSELCNQYLDRGYKLAVVGYFTATGMGFSLRSTPDYNCAALAREFGGNGHDQAAGFNISYSELNDFVAELLETQTITLEQSK